MGSAAICHPPKQQSCTFLLVAGELKKKSALYFSEGQIFAAKIEQAIDSGEEVELSFVGVETVTHEFINGALSQIYYQYSVDVIKKLFHLSGINPDSIIEKYRTDVEWWARNPNVYTEVLENEMSGD